MREILTFILAGGRGERLDPLTRDRAKPAVPFGGIYRIIDFTLSNCINSGLRRIFVLTQYKSFSLQKHLLAGWNVVSNQLGEFIDVIPAQQRLGADWYKGTADAIYQNLYAIYDYNPKLILILAGDHIYKMDYREMVAFHNRKNADMTVACISMPRETAKDFGVIEVDSDYHVRGFQEKPSSPKTIPSDPSQIFASLGIYLFRRDILLDELAADAQRLGSSHDFGKDVIPRMLQNKRGVYVYNFVDENNRPKYWRDIGTRDAYYRANMDLLGPNPAFNLYEKAWPVRTYHEQYPPIRLIKTSAGAGSVVDSIIAGGCVIEGANVERTVLSSNVKIHDQAEVKNSVIMADAVVGAHARIQNAIIDKEVYIPPYTSIGFDAQQDRARFVLTTSGIVIVPKRAKVVP